MTNIRLFDRTTGLRAIYEHKDAWYRSKHPHKVSDLKQLPSVSPKVKGLPVESTASSLESAARHVAVCSHVVNLCEFDRVWMKVDSSLPRGVNLTDVQKAVVDSLKEDILAGAIVPGSLIDAVTVHNCAGLTDGAGKIFRDSVKELMLLDLPPEVKFQLPFVFSPESPYAWLIDIRDVLKHISKSVISSEDYETALGALTSIDLIGANIPDDSKKLFDSLYRKARSGAEDLKRSRGEGYAKPWQRYYRK